MFDGDMNRHMALQRTLITGVASAASDASALDMPVIRAAELKRLGRKPAPGRGITRVTGIYWLAVLQLVFLSSCAMVDHYTGEDVNKPIRETGVSASAEVLKIWDTGVRLNDNPVVGFRLLVTLEDGTAYEAEAKNVISIVHIYQVQPGAVVPVKIDPDNPELVALDIYEER